MTDFYAQLEDQLVAAGRRRQTQGRVGRAVAGRGRAVLGATVVAAAVFAGVAVALPGALSGTSERAPAAQPQVTPAPATTTPGATTTPRAVVPAPSPSLAGIRVAILNGTTRPGLARAAADWLRRRHATVVSVAGNASQNATRTVVLYRSDSRAKARRVAAALGGVPVRASGASPDDVIAVVVLVGTDYRRPPVPAVPRAPAAAPPVATPLPVPVAPGRTAPAAVPVPSARGGYVPAPTATVPQPAATPATPATPTVPPAAGPAAPSAPAP